MMWFMAMEMRMRVSRGGQISIPARIRHHWGTSTIVLDDQGDRVLIEPAPDEPIAAAEGALASEYGGSNVEELRRSARTAEQDAQGRRR